MAIKKGKALAIPDSTDQARDMVVEVGSLLAEIMADDIVLQEAIDKLIADSVKVADEKKKAIMLRLAAIHAYGKANRETLTEQGKTKTIDLGGENCISWRTTPTSVIIEEGKEKAVVRQLRKFRRPDLIIITERVKKAELGREPAVLARLDYVSTSSTEHFYVKPAAFSTSVMVRPRSFRIEGQAKRKKTKAKKK